MGLAPPLVLAAGDSLPLVVTPVMPARGVTDEEIARHPAELLRSARAMSEDLGHATHQDGEG
ncbi:hypothetical protein [Streptomyces triticirhizae]|nr:hypothetical protein [Streptomyces triticirhizae]